MLAAVQLILDLMENDLDHLVSSVSMITFGQPRVGNEAFRQLLNHLIPQYFRAVNEGDPVATVPGVAASTVVSGLL